MSGHTKGPWSVGGIDDNLWVDQADPGENVICDVVNRADGEFTAEDEANARLIAAAPELLEALRPFVGWAVGIAVVEQPDAFAYQTLDGDGGVMWGEVLADDFARALAALAKAEGRP